MGTNLVTMSSISLEAITLTGAVEALDALATFKKQDFPNEKLVLKSF